MQSIFISALKVKSTLWQEGGTGNRIFGDEVADSATSNSSKPQPYNDSEKSAERCKNYRHKKGKRGRKLEKNGEEHDFERSQPLAAMQTLSI